MIHPFEVLNQYTKEKRILEVGDILDFYNKDMDFIDREEDFIPIAYQFRNCFVEEYGFSYDKEDLKIADKDNQYYANRNAVYECTIPYNYQFYFWMNWKGVELEYKPDSSYLSKYSIMDNIEIAANMLGFLRFSDKIVYKTFSKSLIEAIQKYIILSNNNPSYYEESKAKNSLRSIVKNLNKATCDMNIIEPVYKVNS